MRTITLLHVQVFCTVSDCRAEKHFLHGVDDRLHPITGIRQLANGLDNAKVYPIENAGSFIYHDNTPVLLRIVKEIISR